ncbi:hypothetical protein HDU87_002634 [Geranomyces variabilis]|uniref:Uncharacterized protein n=1 Tax=Geranomyces variabilis TaxID=109894 RepID=A0AAD5TW78_9FUNG|nr:hypothetical protein HDU87_002634 [Geranomyces variabilis]
MIPILRCCGHESDEEPEIFVGATKLDKMFETPDPWDWDTTDDELAEIKKKKKAKTRVSNAKLKPKAEKRKVPVTDATDDEPVKPKAKKAKTPVTSRQWSLEERAVAAAKAAKKAKAAASKRKRKVERSSEHGWCESEGEWCEPKERANKSRKAGTHNASSGEKDEGLRTPEPQDVTHDVENEGLRTPEPIQPGLVAGTTDCRDAQSARPHSLSPSPPQTPPAPVTITANLRDWRQTDLQPLFSPAAAEVLALLDVAAKVNDVLTPAQVPVAWGQSVYDGMELRSLWNGRFSSAKLHGASLPVRHAALLWYRHVEDLYPELCHEYECLAALVPRTMTEMDRERATSLLTLPNKERNAIDAARARRLDERGLSGEVAAAAPHAQLLELKMDWKRPHDHEDEQDDNNDSEDDSAWAAYTMPPVSPVAPPYSPLDSPEESCTLHEVTDGRRLSEDWTPVKVEMPSEGLVKISDSPLLNPLALEMDDKDGINLLADEAVTDYEFLIEPQWIQTQAV